MMQVATAPIRAISSPTTPTLEPASEGTRTPATFRGRQLVRSPRPRAIAPGPRSSALRERLSRGESLVQHLLPRVGGQELDEARDDAGPAGLVAGADARAVVAVEVLVEEDVIAPLR